MRGVFGAADILLPQGIDLKKWSVVACDQYTSEPEYWARVAKLVGEAPSSLNMIVPESALSLDPGFAIAGANAAMEKYLADGIFAALKDSLVLTERTLSTGALRRGLVGMIDLERYDYRPGAASPIRATERTVPERLPVRVLVREHAALELPHAMLLIDDPGRTVIEPLARALAGGTPLYDFELMEGGGHLRGFAVTGALAGEAAAEFESFARGKEGRGLPVIAVGDGNHSLAAAKLCWERIKPALTPSERERCPARFALAELVNLHDPALTFEPIHRVIFDADLGALDSELADAHVDLSDVGALQSFLDAFVEKHGGRIDYIHGEEAAVRLGAGEGCRAFLLPPMDKATLIPMVVRDGALPRKAFSMGAAADKRFYLEARRIAF